MVIPTEGFGVSGKFPDIPPSRIVVILVEGGSSAPTRSLASADGEVERS